MSTAAVYHCFRGSHVPKLFWDRGVEMPDRSAFCLLVCDSGKCMRTEQLMTTRPRLDLLRGSTCDKPVWPPYELPSLPAPKSLGVLYDVLPPPKLRSLSHEGSPACGSCSRRPVQPASPGSPGRVAGEGQDDVMQPAPPVQLVMQSSANAWTGNRIRRHGLASPISGCSRAADAHTSACPGKSVGVRQ